MEGDLLSDFTLWINKDGPTKLSGITTITGDRASRKQMHTVVYRSASITVEFPVDSLGIVKVEQNYTLPAGTLTRIELFTIVINFYNAPHTWPEVKRMKGLARKDGTVVLDKGIGHPRGSYLRQSMFAGLRKQKNGTFAVKFA